MGQQPPHPPGKPPDADAADPAAQIDGAALTSLRAVRLARISASGARLAQHIVRQANEAKYVPPEGALMYARLARAVRLTIALERRLGSHDAQSSVDQLGKLNMLAGIGVALIDRLETQSEDRAWFNAVGTLMFARLGNAARRTCALEERIQHEMGLTPGGRDAAEAKRAAEAKARRERPRRHEPDVLPEEAADALADAAGGDPAALPPEQDVIVGAAPEMLREPSVEDELGDRTMAEVAAAACAVTGVDYEPAVFEAAEGDAAADGQPDSGAPVAEEPPRQDPDAGGAIAQDGAPGRPPQEPTHDPPP